MSKVTNLLLQEEVSQARTYLDITTIIAVAVSEYDQLGNLRGPLQDLNLVKQIFVENSDVSLYTEDQIISLQNPTSDQLRHNISRYAESRRARGDILIFYFSGHGSVLGKGEFILCTKDSRTSALEGGGILSTSAVFFRDIIHTLSQVDIRPVFIIDACFSGSTILENSQQIGKIVEDEFVNFGNNYGLLCSSSADLMSKGTPDGGVFTVRLHQVIEQGLGNTLNRNKPFVTLSDIAQIMQDLLAVDGYPLSRLFIGSQLPPIAIAKNIRYRPESEIFTPYFKDIIEYLWNNGEPIEANKSDFLPDIGRGAYANHSKLSRAPWDLVEYGQSKQYRRLSPQGIRFAQNDLAIPRRIIKDSITWEWIADPEAEMIRISDVG